MNFPRANPVLAVHYEPHSGQPLFQTDRGVLENRSDFEAKLLARMLLKALEHARIGEVLDIIGTAVRASDLAVRPAEFGHELAAVLGIGEKDDRGLKGCRGAHGDNVRSTEPVSQVYLCPM
jgi:hypothetical protein